MTLPLLRRLIAGALLSAAVINPHLSGAQQKTGNISFTWGENYELPANHLDAGFIGDAADGYLQISHNPHKSIILQKFDNRLHLTSEEKVSLRDLPRDYHNELFTRLGNTYYWFYSYFERRGEQEVLLCQEVDLKAGKLKGTAREIARTGRLSATWVNNSSYHWEQSYKWQFVWSYDQSKLLVQYRREPERGDKDRTDAIGFLVFDNHMKQLWSREFDMPYSRDMMRNNEFLVDGKGAVYTLAQVYDELKSREKKERDFHFEVLQWTAADGGAAKYILPLKEYVHTGILTEDPSGNVVVTGYYSTQKNSESAEGVFMLKLDAASKGFKSSRQSTWAFPEEVLTSHESARTRREVARKAASGNAGDELRLAKVAMNPDGSVEIYSEEYELELTMGGGGSSGTYIVRTHYFYNIIGMKISADGVLKWARKIPKAQMGSNGTAGLSFKHYSYNGNSYLIFMDNPKNLNLAPNQMPAMHLDGYGGVLAAVRIDEYGNMSRNVIYDVREENVRLNVGDFADVGNHQIMVRAKGRKDESKAALLTFN